MINQWLRTDEWGDRQVVSVPEDQTTARTVSPFNREQKSKNSNDSNEQKLIDKSMT